MTADALPAWLAGLGETATVWELAAAAIGIGAVGYALWGAIDNVFDLRYVKREGVVGGPRWITALHLLIAHVLFVCAWAGYAHVAITAAYLPDRADLGPRAASEIAVMRLGYGICGLLAQVVLRQMRLKLRSLKREQWRPLFGDVDRYAQRYHAAQAIAHGLEAELATQRAEKHAALSRLGSVEAYAQILQRVLRRNGLEVPLEDTFPLEEEPLP
jgi:hypothetical protein